MNLDFHDANRQIGDIERRHPCVHLKRHRLSALDKPEDIHSLAARGLRLAVKLSVLLSISTCAVQPGQQGTLKGSPVSSSLMSLPPDAAHRLATAGDQRYCFDNAPMESF